MQANIMNGAALIRFACTKVVNVKEKVMSGATVAVF
jgi:hypothetical protein